MTAIAALTAEEVADCVRADRLAPDAAFADAARVAGGHVGAGLNAFTAVHARPADATRAEDALLDPSRRGARAVARERGPLAGVPIAVSADLCEPTLPTTAGSRLLARHVAPYEATAVARLLDAGALVVGRTNVDEFRLGATTETSAHGPTRHPRDAARSPGGAAGGAAAAVAAGVVRIALAADTGGGVRHPAAWCGVVGLRPTYGRVSRHGLVALASSMDAVGIVARTVDEAALALSLVAGRDPFDPTSADIEVPAYRVAESAADGDRPLDGLVVGRPREYREGLAPALRACLDRVAQLAATLGAEVRDVSLEHTRLAPGCHAIVAHAEAASALARYDGGLAELADAATSRDDDFDGALARARAAGLGRAARRAVLLGTLLLEDERRVSHLHKAQAVRALVSEDFAGAFDDVDLLLTPTTPAPPVALGARRAPSDLLQDDAYTAAVSLAGLPALSLPIGRADGLPVGAQLVAPHFGEPVLFRTAAALERALGAEAHA